MWFSLLEKGLDLAGKLFASSREESNIRSTCQPDQAAAKVAELNTQIASAVSEVVMGLEGTAHSIVERLVDKLERDQLELLVGQAQGVHFALEFGRDDMLASSLARLSELISYAKNRISEGKSEWLGAWVLAASIRIVSLRQLANSDKARELAAREAKGFRMNLLDYIGPQFLMERKIPWDKIAEYVEGRNDYFIEKFCSEAKLAYENGGLLSQYQNIIPMPGARRSTRHGIYTEDGEDLSEHFCIVVPDLGDLEEVTVIALLVKNGDHVVKGQLVASLETDKTAIDISAPENGRISVTCTNVGERVSSGMYLYHLATDPAAKIKAENLRKATAGPTRSVQTNGAEWPFATGSRP